MAHLITVLFALPAPLVYSVVCALVFLEAAAFVGMVLPGETALLVGSLLAARGTVSLLLLAGLGLAAAVAGDSVGYAVGRRIGPALQDGRLGRRLGPERWSRVHEFVRRHGAWAVVLGRWVGVLRALVPAVAGVTAMPYRRFVVANVLGAAVWVPVVVGVGYTAGASLNRAGSTLGEISLVAVLLLAGGLLVAGRGHLGAGLRRVVRRARAPRTGKASPGRP